MILRPRRDDLRAITWGMGRIVLAVGLLMLIPLLTSLVCAEWDMAINFVIGMLSCLILWLVTESHRPKKRDLTWFQGLVVVSGGWLLATLFGAIPHWLSGHFQSFLDACFDIMSGYTATGLITVQDLDHAAHGFNMWRHVLTYGGGLGIVVIALTFLFAGTAGAFRIYVGEGREEKILPNVVRSARAIWMISLIYLVVFSSALWLVLMREGMPAGRGFLHSLWLVMGAWATAGFTPQSLNLMYYRSFTVELVTLVIFVLGAVNFALHYAVWNGRRREILKNIEVRSFFVTVLLTTLLLAIGFVREGVYTDLTTFFRRGFYNLVSGHTGTGNTTVFSVAYFKEFGFLATFAVITAMAIGGSACSTASGFKGLRMGILFRSIRQEIRRIMSPESAVVMEKVHHLRDIWLTGEVVRTAFLIILCYCAIYFAGAILGMAYGYPPHVAFFDSVSAGSNTGLSAGMVGPTMPNLLKVYFIFSMWAGRLEFVSIFALVGFAGVLWRGRRARKT
jgi:trk system potassium uptake protein TrkH